MRRFRSRGAPGSFEDWLASIDTEALAMNANLAICRAANYFARIGCANTSRCPFRSITSNSIIP